MKIGIVNDSAFAMEALRRVVESEKVLKIVWTASDGVEAVEKCRQDRPDLILMDLMMPNMDGVEATRRIMKETPCSILIVTALMDDVGRIFEAMGAGAIDVVATPQQASVEGRQLLLEKIRSIAALTDFKEVGRWIGVDHPAHASAGACVLIGSSAGGPAALMEIVAGLPATLPVPVVIVQHIDSRFASELASWLGTRSALPVHLARDGEQLSGGNILVSEGGQHLVFSEEGKLHYTNEPRISYQPSVDVFFESALRCGPKSLLGIILTGMGRDGAEGLKQMRLAGHPTIAQDKMTSAIYGMPKAAVEMGAAGEVLPLSRIAGRIVEWSTKII